MKVVIPMAGFGERFVQAGYQDPKPIIRIGRTGRKRIVEYVLDMFSEGEDDITFICNQTHMMYTPIRDVLKGLVPSCTVLSVPPHKKGPIHTVMESGYLDSIDPDDELVVSYCDNPHLWSRERFIAHTRDHALDGCILTHTGFHPHTLSSTKMAFVKEKDSGDPANLISEIKEKACYTEDPQSEHASTGMYWFRTAEIAKKYFTESLSTGNDENGLTYKGEHYVTLVYNLLVRDGLRVGFYDTPFVTVFGTPREVRNFEAWKEILGGGQIKGDGSAEDERNLVECYRYWTRYKKWSNTK
jgi:NDP-sugar pyrophosphorylase family protein